MTDRLVVYRTRSLRKSQRYGWRLVTPNGRTIATSGEGYTRASVARGTGLAVANGAYSSPVVVMP